MGRLSRLNRKLRQEYRMKTIVRYAGPLKADKSQDILTKELHNVGSYGINQAGIYMFRNGDQQDIFHVPAGAIIDIEWPDHDTNLTIPQVKLAV